MISLFPATFNYKKEDNLTTRNSDDRAPDQNSVHLVSLANHCITPVELDESLDFRPVF